MKIKLNNTCPLCKKEVILGNNVVIKKQKVFHLECYEKIMFMKPSKKSKNYIKAKSSIKRLRENLG
jgi:hypothetical protein